MATTVAFFFLLWSSVIAQLHEEGDNSCRHLLLPTVQLQRSSTKKATTATIAFFFMLCNCSAAPQKKRR
jgi:hypothetical protein